VWSLAGARARCWKLYKRYYGDGRYVHFATRYRAEIARYARPGACLLDAGCGETLPFTRELAPKVGLAVGVDIGTLRPPAGAPCGVQGDLHALPFRDGSFDVVVSMSVVEHLDAPERVFQEWARILRPGGALVVLTPNKWDYVSLIAWGTPFRFHQWIVSRVQDREAEDVFPTRFRGNTRPQVRAILERSGLECRTLELFNQYPSYLMVSPLLFRLGVAYERLTSRWEALAALRNWILIVGTKPPVTSGAVSMPRR
jgi:SAM-dependent methyltransferase